MRNAAFRKSSRRAVKSSLARFVSLALISFLGAGMFAGLTAVSPNMRRAGNEYYKAQNVMDFRMLSTYGFSDEDVESIRKTSGVSGVMASYDVDATGTVGDRDYAFRLNGLPASNGSSDPGNINRLKLTAGRWPKSNGEAIIVRPSIGLKNIKLGATVSLNKASNDALSDTLGRTSYQIVGIAESAYYLSFVQGTTTVGNGSIDYVLYVPRSNFTVDAYTNLYVTMVGAKQCDIFGTDYLNSLSAEEKRLNSLAGSRKTLRYDKFRSDLDHSKRDYADSKKDADKKLSDAKSALDRGTQSLADAQKKYDSGLSQYSSQKTTADGQLSEAWAKLEAASAQISSGTKELAAKKAELAGSQSKLQASRKKLDAGWADYNPKAAQLEKEKAVLAKNKSSLDSAQAQYNAAASAAERETGMKMEQIEAALASMKASARDAKAQAQVAQLASLVAEKNELAQKPAQFDAISREAETAGAQLGAAKQSLENGEREYSAGSAQLRSAETQISAAENGLAAAETSYRSGLSQYNAKKAEAESRLSGAKASLDKAKSAIQNGKAKLAEKQRDYDTKKSDADTKLSDAARKISDAEKKLSDAGRPEWYVFGRDKDASFVSYKDDTQKMHDLATVFPVIFFLVAALVCLTTMTRMVDEDRTLIGTLKALGYSNVQIAGRYLRYAAAASLIGSVGGVCFGFWLLPTIVWSAYNIIFSLPPMTPLFYPDIAFLSIFATAFIILLSTGVAAKRSLFESPASLMRPKAPKSGRRVLLEHVKPIWSRMKFIKKVTVRNLGLNRKRLVMTVIGILGCTSLLVTALGAKNAVRVLLSDQFGTIFHYNVTVGFNGKKPSAALVSRLNDKSYFKESTEMFRMTAEASAKDGSGGTNEVNVISPENENDFADYITLNSPDRKTNLKLGENSAVLTEKLAMELHIGVGGTVMVKYPDENEQHAVTVTGIVRNNTFHYLYLGRSAYEKAFGKPPEYNQFYAVAAGGHNDGQIKSFLTSASGFGAITFTSDLIGNVRTTIKSVDNIIWILIIAAGLLAFVVLYNLTNINVGERQRELATLKVLGFYDRETYSYIFRETVVLSAAGCLLGLVGGIFLYRAVITTVEPNIIMLTRELTWESYLGAVALTMLFTWFVNQCMKPRIRNIDMLESMKSTE